MNGYRLVKKSETVLLVSKSDVRALLCLHRHQFNVTLFHFSNCVYLTVNLSY